MLIIGPLPPPFGGVQMVVEMQVRSSLAREFSVDVVDTSKRRLRYVVGARSWRTPLYFLRDLARLARALLRRRPDAVLVHAVSDLSLLRDWAFMASARLAGAKVVCYYHGTLHSRFPSGTTRWGRLAGRLLMRAAHRVIALGPTYREEMAAAWRRDDIAWAPNTADVALFRQANAAAAPWLAPGERAILFVGRLSAPKGLYDLFDAVPQVLARHPEARFVLVGVAESEALEPAIRAEAARRGIAPRVSFLGALEGRDKAAAFAAAQLLVLPSWTEGFPLVIPEAMAAGLPVVATAVGAIPDFVRDGEDGFLVAPRDAAALAERICRLLADEPLRRRMGEHVRARAPREFAIDVGARRVAGVIREALAA